MNLKNFEVPKELIPSDPRFGVGPSLIPVDFIDRLRGTGAQLLGTSHRKPRVVELVKEIHLGLRAYFNLPADYEILIGNGGASFFFDMIALGLVKKRSSHFVCGEFSNKWYLSHEAVPWIDTKLHEMPYGHGIDAFIEEDVDFICTTLNETSTGVMLPDLPDAHSEDVLVGVDATSSAGQIKIDFQRSDVYFFSPQKVFASEGGTYVAILSPKAIARFKNILSMNRYVPPIMNFASTFENAKKFQTLNTPSISGLFYLNEQLKLMNKRGEDEIVRDSKIKAGIVYDWAQEKGYLSPFVKDEKYRSHTVATIDVDDAYSVTEIANYLRTHNLAYDVESYRKLNRNQLRISLFYNVKKEDLRKLCQLISKIIES